MPSKPLERRLKEMGYDMSGAKNKKSLGARKVRLLKFSKLALASKAEDIDRLIALLGQDNYRKIVRYIIPNPLTFFAEARSWVNPDEKMAAAREGFASQGVPMNPEVASLVRRIIEDGVADSQSFVIENPISETIGTGQSLAPEDLLD